MKHQYAPANMPTETAEEVASVLQGRLSTLIDFSLTLKHIHWNVVGMGFVAVHELMDQQAETIRIMVDAVAERIATLGGVAAGLAGQVSDIRDADGDYELGRAEVMAHLGALDKVYESVTTGHRSAIEAVADLDPVTEDLLVGQAGDLEMAHWFIRAHISNLEGQLVTAQSDNQIDAAVTAAAEMQPGVELTDEDPNTRSESSKAQTASQSG